MIRGFVTADVKINTVLTQTTLICTQWLI